MSIVKEEDIIKNSSLESLIVPEHDDKITSLALNTKASINQNSSDSIPVV